MPQSLRKDIREYFQTIMLTMQQQNDLSSFINNISPSLALRVRGHMFENVLRDKNKIIKQTQMLIISQTEMARSKSMLSRMSTLSESIESPLKRNDG